ncbi:hypothetical protein ACFO9Q_10955 [Paenibacillus sp. GCM10023252]|uniref:hypothetical protein n=1 Tax=Paenibacillus sp. GCM10023252 TaxID=3252649 RepID=UPI003618D1D3
MNDNLLFVLGVFLVIAFIVTIVNYKKLGSKFNRSYSGEISLKEIKNFYFKKQYCNHCNQKLIRVHDKEFIEEGWDNINGTHFYGKKYKVKTYLKCQECQKKYKLEDLMKE